MRRSKVGERRKRKEVDKEVEKGEKEVGDKEGKEEKGGRFSTSADLFKQMKTQMTIIMTSLSSSVGRHISRSSCTIALS